MTKEQIIDVDQARDQALELGATIAECYARGRPIASQRPSDLMYGRWEGEQAASTNIARLIRDSKTPHWSRNFTRYHLGEPFSGPVFPSVPLLTDKQEQRARVGVCPACAHPGLSDMGRGEGLRFMGCLACSSVVVLTSRPDDRLMSTIHGRRIGRSYMAQQVGMAVRTIQSKEADQ